MDKPDYIQQLAELQLIQEERELEKRRKFVARVMEPFWWIGILAGYLVTGTALFTFIPGHPSVYGGIYSLSVLIYLELWNFRSPIQRPVLFDSHVVWQRITQALQAIQTEKRQFKAIALTLVIPAGILINLLFLHLFPFEGKL